MATTTEQPLTAELYKQLQEVFSLTQNELFQMEAPARLVEMGNYHYDGSHSINHQHVNPPAAIEAEFRLVDGMLSLTNLVGGINRDKLSETYNELLFVLD